MDEHAVNTPKEWPFPQSDKPKPGMPMYLWAPHIEAVKDLRGKIWEDLARNDRTSAKARAQEMMKEVQKLINTLEAYDG